MRTREIGIVALEMLTIGIIALIYNVLLYRAFRGKFPSLDEGSKSMLIGSFLLGAWMHLSFEYTGTNEWWCKSTYDIK